MYHLKRRTLGIPDEERMYVVLVNRKGEVLWRVDGPFNEDKARDLKFALAGLYIGTTR